MYYRAVTFLNNYFSPNEHVYNDILIILYYFNNSNEKLLFILLKQY